MCIYFNYILPHTVHKKTTLSFDHAIDRSYIIGPTDIGNTLRHVGSGNLQALDQRVGVHAHVRRRTGIFSFLYLKKTKISKIYVRFEIFQNYPRSLYGGRQDLSVIFILQICNEVHGKKTRGPVAPPKRATGACRPPTGAHQRGDSLSAHCTPS